MGLQASRSGLELWAGRRRCGRVSSPSPYNVVPFCARRPTLRRGRVACRNMTQRCMKIGAITTWNEFILRLFFSIEGEGEVIETEKRLRIRCLLRMMMVARSLS